MLAQYGHVFLFVLFGMSFAIVNLLVAYLVRFNSNDKQQKIAYECGMPPLGTPYVPTDIRFYVYALLFVVFDVESLFMYPWAVVFRQIGLPGFLEMTAFVAVLALGLMYVWKRGALEWES